MSSCMDFAGILNGKLLLLFKLYMITKEVRSRISTDGIGALLKACQDMQPNRNTALRFIGQRKYSATTCVSNMFHTRMLFLNVSFKTFYIRTNTVCSFIMIIIIIFFNWCHLTVSQCVGLACFSRS